MFVGMKRYIALAIFVLFSEVVSATHNRAGEITFRQLSALTYEITIVTYTKGSSPADRPALLISWGDGLVDSIPRTFYADLANDVRHNIYTANHSYPGPADYWISVEDPNRNLGVENIPNSVNVPFFIMTELQINPFVGVNNSPQLLNPPIDQGCLGKKFVHNPMAFDVDGDSLSYKLVPCMDAPGHYITGYTYPIASTSFTLNPVTGDLIWDSPTHTGEYNVAILIEEWRHGHMIGQVTRDMQITILKCDNDPPVIDPIPNICILAGDTVRQHITAHDPNLDFLTMTATGGPFQVANPAIFIQPVTGSGTVANDFTWVTDCGNVQTQPYQVLVKVQDVHTDQNFITSHLVDLKSFQIEVVGPAPENLSAVALGNTIRLHWDPDACPQVVGYKIYRRNGAYGSPIPCPCQTGVPSYTGYAFLGNDSGYTNTAFIDDGNGIGLVHGTDYCYMVVAVFPDSALSCASAEACAQLKKDLPVITNVDVITTDATNGEINIAWSKPTELDTVQNPGPFRYRIYRSDGFFGASFQLIDSTGMIDGLNDTLFTDHHTPINTDGIPYSYRILLVHTNSISHEYEDVGTSQTASSVWLSISPSDNKLNLSWEEHVPWTDTLYYIYRWNSSLSQFDSIGNSPTRQYSDTGLANGVNYCYKVRSIGKYSGAGFVFPILNNSEQKCAAAVDNVPPCAPVLNLLGVCKDHENILNWNNPNASCADDVLGYYIYYSPTQDGALVKIDSISDPQITTYIHSNLLISIAGCYMIVAYDSVGNESQDGIKVCVDNCPLYALPNVFTPDGNGFNDLFLPLSLEYVKDIDIKIYNRWGEVVFSTTDPGINWDGKNMKSKNDCPDGVYYYICFVHEIHLEGIRPVLMKGFFHLIRGR